MMPVPALAGESARRLGPMPLIVRHLFKTFLGLSALLCLPHLAYGQMSTAEQLEIFQTLPAEERAALLEAMNLGPDRPDEAEELDQPELMQPMEAFPDDEQERDLENLRVQGGDTLVVTTSIREDADPQEVNRFLADTARYRVLGSRSLAVDKNGILKLASIGDIPLAGLSAEEVAIRLESEPLLSLLEIEVAILPLEPVGAAALKPFGYDLFQGVPTTFAPATDIPIPSDYIIGPGDTLRIQLWGNTNRESYLLVNRDGTINFPQIGPRPVAGLTLGELKGEISQYVEQELIGTRVSVTMGELRSIQIFVVGEVRRPGSYTVGGLSTMTNAIFASGGITEVGSLRRVQLKRDGRLVQTLDLYDLLLNGDTRRDSQLQPGDVILIPPAENTVGIDGEIRRPAIYEMTTDRGIEELIRLAGGVMPNADTSSLRLERVVADGRRVIETLNLGSERDRAEYLQAGDLLTVFPVEEDMDEAVYLAGHVNRPGFYEWSPGMTLTQLLPSERMLRARADLGYVLIRREEGPDRQISVISADLKEALKAPGSDADLRLQARDKVQVFELGISRGSAVQEILNELDAQSTLEKPYQAVTVGGQVRAPGSYPLETGMRLSDLIRAGGGLADSAYSADSEMTRYVVAPDGSRRTVLLKVDLEGVTAGDPEADILLQPYDFLNIKETPEWQDQFQVNIAGEVRFPGTYPVRRGENLSSLIQRAGGLTQLAFPEGAIFTRASLRQRESEQLEVLTRRLESDLSALALQAAQSPDASATQAYGLGQSLLTQLRAAEPVGRLVIDLVALIENAGDPDFDVVLKNGDTLSIPSFSQEVTVLGEVQYATSHLFDPGRGRDTYIGLSGGLTPNADSKRIYVVRANGAVVASSGSRWFSRGNRVDMRPGDTVVVPLDADRLNPIVAWTNVTSILSNLAIAVAALQAL